jgi:hypothetical protein
MRDGAEQSRAEQSRAEWQGGTATSQTRACTQGGQKRNTHPARAALPPPLPGRQTPSQREAAPPANLGHGGTRGRTNGRTEQRGGDEAEEENRAWIWCAFECDEKLCARPLCGKSQWCWSPARGIREERKRGGRGYWKPSAAAFECISCCGLSRCRILPFAAAALSRRRPVSQSNAVGCVPTVRSQLFLHRA